MNIKGILRSSAAKLIAFVCIVGCFAGALFLTENTITDFAVDNGSNMVYRFEGDFADSVLHVSAAQHNVCSNDECV